MDPLPAPGAPSGAAPRLPRRPDREGRPAPRDRAPAARPLRAVAVAPDRAVPLTRAVVLIIQAVHVAVAAHQPATSGSRSPPMPSPHDDRPDLMTCPSAWRSTAATSAPAPFR